MDYDFHPDSTFPSEIDLQSVIQYIIPIPNINSLIPSANYNYTQNFQSAQACLLRKQKQIDKFQSHTEDIIEKSKYILNPIIPKQEDKKIFRLFDFATKKKSENIDNENLNAIDQLHSQKAFLHPAKIEGIRKLEILRQKYYKTTLKVIEVRKNLEADFRKKIKNLLLVCNYFIENPQPFILDIHKALPSEIMQMFSQHRKLMNRFNQLRYVVHVKANLIDLFPTHIFTGTINQNQNFIKHAIDLAIQQRKVETSYFEPLSCESLMFSFFESPVSPIYEQINQLKTLQNTTKEADITQIITQWISQAANIIFNYVYPKPDTENKDENEIKLETISIFLVRFVFDFTFPWLDRKIEPDPHFSKALEEISKKTPREMKFSLSFVKPELVDRPCVEIYSHGSVAQAPVEYLLAAQYETCPLRAAYCINKAHESVSVMAALQAAQNSQLTLTISETSIRVQPETSADQPKSNEILPENQNDDHQDTKNFFSKLPGFDDIFEFWISLLCVANVADVRGLNNFLLKWKRLPGFSSRFRAACAYLEAAIAHIEAYDNEEEEEQM